MPKETAETRTLEQILATLSEKQLEYVAARMYAKNDKEAAAVVGIADTTAYSWPNKQDVNEAVRLAKLDGVNVARERLKRLANDAVSALGDLVKDKKGPRLSAAVAVLDRVGMPETQRHEVSGKDGGPIEQRITEIVVELPPDESMAD